MLYREPHAHMMKGAGAGCNSPALGKVMIYGNLQRSYVGINVRFERHEKYSLNELVATARPLSFMRVSQTPRALGLCFARPTALRAHHC
jgi:hypothetical protein